MCGYMTKKLEHLLPMVLDLVHQPVLAYLLQDTHLLARTMILGIPVENLVLLVPSPFSASHKG